MDNDSLEMFKKNAIHDLDVEVFISRFFFPTDYERLSYTPASYRFYKKLDTFYADHFGDKEWAGLMSYFARRLVSLKTREELTDMQVCMKALLEKESDALNLFEAFSVSEHKLIVAIADREKIILSGDVKDVRSVLLRGDVPQSAKKDENAFNKKNFETSRLFGVYQNQKELRKLIEADYYILKHFISVMGDLINVDAPSNSALSKVVHNTAMLSGSENFVRTKKIVEDLDVYGQAGIVISHDYFENVGNVFTTKLKPTFKSIRDMTSGIRKNNGTKRSFLNMPENGELMLVKSMEFLVEGLFADILTVIACGRNVEFYLNAVRYVYKVESLGLPIVFPSFFEGRSHVQIKGLYNPVLFKTDPFGRILTSTASVVSNNVTFDKDGAVIVLTGPNNTGKSVYAKSIGLATLLAQNGLPIPAKSAIMCTYDRVLTHVISTGSIEKGEGMFVEELRRIKGLFEAAFPETLIIIDEPVKGSSFEDSEAIALRVLEGLKELGAHTCLTTHLHNVAAEVDTWDGVLNMCTEVKDGVSTHRIVLGQEKSYGLSVADTYGLTRENILAIVREKKKK